MLRYKKNLLVVLVNFLASASSAIVGFHHPNALLSITDTTITSLSIIFGLSIAVFSLASGKVQRLIEENPVDPLLARQIVEKINHDNKLTTNRQELLMSMFLFSVILGIIFKAADKIPELSAYLPIVSAFFAFFASASLLSAFFLPNLLGKLHKRNRHFGIK